MDNTEKNQTPPNPLNSEYNKFVSEHYERVYTFWTHWTNTIWSMPSVATAINFGGFYVIFNGDNNVSVYFKIAVLVILLVLNIALTKGMKSHLFMQRHFGSRILEIERANGIPIIDFRNPRGGEFFNFAMYVIIIINILAILYVTANKVWPDIIPM